jgi:glycosyltransferase involved in cell wall biosynthesis
MAWNNAVVNSQRKILFVLPSYAGGGAERVTLTLLRGLDRNRFSPHLLVMNGEGPLASLVPEDVPVTDLKCPRLRHALPGLRRGMREQQPDLVFSSLGYMNFALILLRGFMVSAPRLVLREANLPSLSLARTSHPRLYRFFYRHLYPCADRVIASSVRMLEELQQDYAVDESRLVVLPNPVDEVKIRRQLAEPQRLPGPGRRFVAAGRLNRQKGFDRLLEWFAEMDDTDQLVLLGDGPDRSDLESAVEQLGLTGRVHFKGFVGNPWCWYAAADAFLLSSRWEGMPNAALEALACGVKVIGTPESGGLTELADAAKDGAVSVVSAGPEFIAAMKSVDAHVPVGIRESLLPDQYRSAQVANAFQELLLDAL